MAAGNGALQHDPEKWRPVFPRDKRGMRLREGHAEGIDTPYNAPAVPAMPD